VLINVKVNNEVALLRYKFRAFSKWRLESQIEKRVLDRRQ